MKHSRSLKFVGRLQEEEKEEEEEVQGPNQQHATYAVAPHYNFWAQDAGCKILMLSANSLHPTKDLARTP